MEIAGGERDGAEEGILDQKKKKKKVPGEVLWSIECFLKLNLLWIF